MNDEWQSIETAPKDGTKVDLKGYDSLRAFEMTVREGFKWEKKAQSWMRHDKDQVHYWGSGMNGKVGPLFWKPSK